MKVIKPNFVTPLPAVFDDGRRLHCVVTAIFHATFDGELCEERLLWPAVGEDVEGMVLDEAMPKSKAEYLVHGSCFAREPGVRQSFVKVRFGSQEKTLAVFGKRRFELGDVSEPEPFDAVPIRWTHAFGGPRFAENPAGKGHGGGELPQVELRGHLMQAPGDRPPPGGFGRVDVALPRRMKKLGTYDTRWLKTRYPGMAEDVDMTHFQLASPDQWRDEFFQGDESFSVVNMHPERAQVDGKLPGIIARVFVKRVGEEAVDVPMHIDTVHLLPHRERQVVVCRGGVPTRSDTLDDVEEIGLALEWIGRPKRREHYEEIFAARRWKKDGALAHLDDDGLLPETPPKKKARIVAPGEGLQARQIRRHLEHQHEAAKRQLAEQGIDPRHLPPLPTIDLGVDPDELPPMADPPPTIDGVKAQVAEKRAEAAAQMREELERSLETMPEAEAAKVRAEVDGKLAAMELDVVGPPALSRAQVREQLEQQLLSLDETERDVHERMGRHLDPESGDVAPDLAQLQEIRAQLRALLDDREQDQRLLDLDAMVCETYRTSVQHQRVPPALEGDANAGARTRAQLLVESREPFARIDLTGADLSALDLQGADLRGAWLEATDLKGTKLDGADLENAVLARAKLTGSDLRRCKVAGANFSEADLTGADLRGLDLRGCFFVRTDLTDARLEGALLDGADLTGARLLRTDLSSTRLKNALLHDLAFTEVKLAGSQWEKSTLYRCSLTGVDARRAQWSLVLLVDSTVSDTSFDDARLVKLQACRIEKQPQFHRCTFVGAALELCLFRGNELIDCDLSHSDFEGSDFSKARIERSRFSDARGKNARFVDARAFDCRFERADLADALFGSSILDRTTFEDANLFRADFGRSGGADTNMRGANLQRVRTVPKRLEAP